MNVDRDAVQGMVLRGYPEKKHAAFALLRIDDPARFRAWLRALPVTDGVVGRDRDVPAYRHIAFSWAGFEALGASPPVDEPLRAGMASARARAITGDDDPATWAWDDREVHALLLAYGADDDAVRAELARVDGSGAALVRVLDTVDLGGVEHFGFADGLSQPDLEQLLGEIVLGYPDAFGDRVDDPWLRNGSYLVIRQLYQDVPAFWRSIAARADNGDRVELAAKMVGRWPSGAPLVRAPDGDRGRAYARDNSFGFRELDPEGHLCPFGSHIRRMHPRDWMIGNSADSATAVGARRRMLRRGRPYGPPTGLSAADMARHPEHIPEADRGLYFVALQADLHRQFEFVQQTWANNPKFAGLDTDPDPLIGRGARRDFTIQRAPVRRRVRDLPEIVKLVGGGYFFLPSLPAIRAISAG